MSQEYAYCQTPGMEIFFIKVLVVEIVVVTVAAFGKFLIPQQTEETDFLNEGMNITQNSMGINTVGEGDSIPQTAPIELSFEMKESQECDEVTITDTSTIPPSSKIQRVCN